MQPWSSTSNLANIRSSITSRAHICVSCAPLRNGICFTVKIIIRCPCAFITAQSLATKPYMLGQCWMQSIRTMHVSEFSTEKDFIALWFALRRTSPDSLGACGGIRPERDSQEATKAIGKPLARREFSNWSPERQTTEVPFGMKRRVHYVLFRSFFETFKRE